MTCVGPLTARTLWAVSMLSPQQWHLSADMCSSNRFTFSSISSDGSRTTGHRQQLVNGGGTRLTSIGR